jgi:hypothetical protein
MADGCFTPKDWSSAFQEIVEHDESASWDRCVRIADGYIEIGCGLSVGVTNKEDSLLYHEDKKESCAREDGKIENLLEILRDSFQEKINIQVLHPLHPHGCSKEDGVDKRETYNFLEGRK